MLLITNLHPVETMANNDPEVRLDVFSNVHPLHVSWSLNFYSLAIEYLFYVYIPMITGVIQLCMQRAFESGRYYLVDRDQSRVSMPMYVRDVQSYYICLFQLLSFLH
jgi:hypothetical protein